MLHVKMEQQSFVKLPDSFTLSQHFWSNILTNTPIVTRTDQTFALEALLTNDLALGKLQFCIPSGQTPMSLAPVYFFFPTLTLGTEDLLYSLTTSM